MPGRDGTGPLGGQGKRGGRLRGNQPGIGPGGDCVCPACGEKAPHKQGAPCYNMRCPKYGASMVRE